MQKKTFILKEIRKQLLDKAHFKSGIISFISIAPAMTSEVIIITRQYCNYYDRYDEMRASEVNRLQAIINQQRSNILTLGDNLRELAQAQQIGDSSSS